MTGVNKVITRPTEGKNQLGAVVGKPSPGDTVKVKYRGFSIELKNGKRGPEFIDTEHIGRKVVFQVSAKGGEQEGLYIGLNEAVQSMNLGEEAEVTIPSEMAFGSLGLDKFYDPSSGYLKSVLQITGTVMPNHPNAPANHHNRNPLCIAYQVVQPGESVLLQLSLMEINNHRRALPEKGCLDCLVSSITGAFGLNSGTH